MDTLVLAGPIQPPENASSPAGQKIETGVVLVPEIVREAATWCMDGFLGTGVGVFVGEPAGGVLPDCPPPPLCGLVGVLAVEELPPAPTVTVVVHPTKSKATASRNSTCRLWRCLMKPSAFPRMI